MLQIQTESELFLSAPDLNFSLWSRIRTCNINLSRIFWNCNKTLIQFLLRIRIKRNLKDLCLRLESITPKNFPGSNLKLVWQIFFREFVKRVNLETLQKLRNELLLLGPDSFSLLNYPFNINNPTLFLRYLFSKRSVTLIDPTTGQSEARGANRTLPPSDPLG